MTAALLLFAAMLAADNPAPVQAKVLYGTAAEQQQQDVAITSSAQIQCIPLQPRTIAQEEKSTEEAKGEGGETSDDDMPIICKDICT